MLEPLFLEDPDSFRTSIELAISKVASSGDYAQGAAILAQASLFGVKDATYVATLAGMQFLSKRIDAARETFAKGKELPPEEQRAIPFRPMTRIGDMQFGTVSFRSVS